MTLLTPEDEPRFRTVGDGVHSRPSRWQRSHLLLGPTSLPAPPRLMHLHLARAQLAQAWPYGAETRVGGGWWLWW